MANIITALIKADILLQRLTGEARAIGQPFSASIYEPLIAALPKTSPITIVSTFIQNMTGSSLTGENLVDAILEHDTPVDKTLQNAINFLNRLANTKFIVGQVVPEEWHQNLLLHSSTPLLIASHFFNFDILDAISKAIYKDAASVTTAKKPGLSRAPVKVIDLIRIVNAIFGLFKKTDPTEEASARIYGGDVGQIAREMGFELTTPELSYVIDRLQDKGIIVKSDLVQYEGFEKDLKLHGKPKSVTHPIFSGRRGPSTYYVRGKKRTIYQQDLGRPRALMAGRYLRKGGGRRSDMQPIIDIPIRLKEEELQKLREERAAAHKAQKVDLELIEMMLDEWAGYNLKSSELVNRTWQSHNLSIGEFIKAAGLSAKEKEIFIKKLRDASVSMNLLVNTHYLAASIREEIALYKSFINQGRTPKIFFLLKGWNPHQIDVFEKLLKEKCGIE